MTVAKLRLALFGLAMTSAAACAGPTGPGDLGSGLPFGPEAPGPSGPSPGSPSGNGICALPLPPEGCQDTPGLPFPADE